MPRYIGIDFGDARVGVASSDLSGLLASAQGHIKVNGLQDAANKTAEKIKELSGEAIVLGMPKNMDGSMTYRADRTKEFAALLTELTGLPLFFEDERLSTAEAYRYLNITDYKSKKRKSVIDALSAQIILQAFLDARKNRD